MMDLFITNTKHKLMDWSLVDYCDVLSADGTHPDGTHSLHVMWCNAKFIQICLNKKTNCKSKSWIII